jgi:hypothetical protein
MGVDAIDQTLSYPYETSKECIQFLNNCVNIYDIL